MFCQDFWRNALNRLGGNQVCKTLIRRFDSDPRLQYNRLHPHHLATASASFVSRRIRTNTDQSGPIRHIVRLFCQADWRELSGYGSPNA